MNAIIKQIGDCYKIYELIDNQGHYIEWQDTYQTKEEALARVKALGYYIK